MLSDGLCDGSAADDQLALIEHHGLTGCDSPLRLVKYHPGFAIVFGIDGAGLLRLAVADLH